jgi:hypothetical protein
VYHLPSLTTKASILPPQLAQIDFPVLACRETPTNQIHRNVVCPVGFQSGVLFQRAHLQQKAIIPRLVVDYLGEAYHRLRRKGTVLACNETNLVPASIHIMRSDQHHSVISTSKSESCPVAVGLGDNMEPTRYVCNIL